MHLVVGEPAEVGNDAEAANRHADRRAVLGRLREAALRAALANLSLWGWVICGAAGLGVSALPLAPSAWVWGALALAMGIAATAATQLSKPASITASAWTQVDRRLTLYVAVLSVVMAAAPWLHWTLTAGDPRVPLAMALALSSVALVGAAALAPVRGLEYSLCLMPVSMALISLTRADRWPAAIDMVAQLLIGLGVLVVSRQRGRHWRQNTRALIEQGDEIRRLKEERDQAARGDAEKGRFLAIASHDLRQPVHALALFTATLHRRLQTSPEEPLVRNMVRAIDGLERSFNALLDISRLDGGAISPTLQTFSLRDIFRRLHMHYGGQAELAGLALRFSPGGKSVHSDPQLLERVLGNLIQNAIKYTEHGGVVVLARSTEKAINIEVWDTGFGIAPNDLPRIFDEYFQVGRGERDRSHGLGMGLSIVKRLVKSLGHRLTVSSRQGHGSMFRIGILKGELSGMNDAMAPSDTVPMLISRPQMVLVIDDEEPIREGLRGLLQEWGYQAMTAASAAQAEHVAHALEGRIDLILSDLHLGGEADGLEAIDRVRLWCRHEVPAILITGDTAHGEIRRIAASGHMVLFKPVQPRRLFEALRNQGV